MRIQRKGFTDIRWSGRNTWLVTIQLVQHIPCPKQSSHLTVPSFSLQWTHATSWPCSPRPSQQMNSSTNSCWYGSHSWTGWDWLQQQLDMSWKANWEWLTVLRYSTPSGIWCLSKLGDKSSSSGVTRFSSPYGCVWDWSSLSRAPYIDVKSGSSSSTYAVCVVWMEGWSRASWLARIMILAWVACTGSSVSNSSSWAKVRVWTSLLHLCLWAMKAVRWGCDGRMVSQQTQPWKLAHELMLSLDQWLSLFVKIGHLYQKAHTDRHSNTHFHYTNIFDSQSTTVIEILMVGSLAMNLSMLTPQYIVETNYLRTVMCLANY